MTASKSDNDEATLPLTNDAPKDTPTRTVHPAVYISVWIFFSSATILFNKWILHTLNFPYPIFLTTCHLIFATIATRLLSKTTSLLNGIADVKMNWEIYMKAVVPIGLCFSLSLVFSNYAYLYLSVAYIQMLKATTPVAVLLAGYLLRVEKYDPVILGKVSIIVVGVMIASYGEFEFVLIGVILQSLGIAAEATRLVLVQQLLKGYNMDPLVSLYYFAPVCAVMNAVAFAFVESSSFTFAAFGNVGFPILIINCTIAFLLNVAVVFLIGKTSSLVMCLSGVLKDIILVVASVLIWWTTVTRLQMAGYATALAGLVWYKQPNIDRRRLIIGWAVVVGLVALSSLHDVSWNASSFTPSYPTKIFSSIKSSSGLDTICWHRYQSHQ
ncbi:triose-phosphate transporter family-domain-containing protein [Chytridium lagenaria]|nr:triose-phosphate transporter family-domain-containing protein [Chytridium lagenaria]